MTNALQISGKHADGTIIVVGGNTFAEFSENLIAFTDQETAEAILGQARGILTPISWDDQLAAQPQSPPPTPQAAQTIPPNMTTSVVQPGYPLQPAPAPAFVAPPDVPPAPQAPAQPQQAGVPSCQHGMKQYKQGVSAKTGNPWSAWMCPAPKGTPDQCEPEWRR